MAIAAVAVYLGMNNGGGDSPKPSTGIDIVDGSGASIHLDAPIESCYVMNTNIPTAMKILGLQDNVSEILFYKSSKYDYFHDAGFKNITSDAPLYSTLTNAEYFMAHGVKYILEPVESQTLSDTVERACRDAGITIIKLECFGETMLEDFEKIVKIFGSTDKVKKAYNDYLGIRGKVVDAVFSKVQPTDDNLFLFGFMGLNAFYNGKAELSKIAEKIYGKNAITLTGATSTGVTNKATDEGLWEALTKLNGEKPVKMLFLRASADDQASDLLSKWNKTAFGKYDLAYKNGLDNVYVIDSDLLSGPMDYIGYVSMAELSGIDTGYSVRELVEQYVQLYGFAKETSIYTWQIVFDSSGKATKVIDAGIDGRNASNFV